VVDGVWTCRVATSVNTEVFLRLEMGSPKKGAGKTASSGTTKQQCAVVYRRTGRFRVMMIRSAGFVGVATVRAGGDEGR